LSPGLRAVVAAAALAAAAAWVPAAAAPDASEAEIKAAYLCKFGNYVEWPAGAASAAAGPSFGIAIAGSEAETDVLQRVAVGSNVDGRPIRVRRLAAGDTLLDERIVYVTHSQAARAAELAPAAIERRALLVTEAADPGSPGGMVNFVIEDNRVRFDVDVAEAAAAHLKLSARLLTVARRVQGAAP
jgi:hypothetical protein